MNGRLETKSALGREESGGAGVSALRGHPASVAPGDAEGQAFGDLSDEELLLEAASGDQESFRRLVERYRAPLFHFLARYVGDAHRAEDLFQETFVAVHANLARFRPAARVRPWIFTIAVNLARDEFRRRRVRPDLAGPVATYAVDGERLNLMSVLEAQGDSPLDHLESQERAELVRRAVDELPGRGREALLLFYFEGLKYHEIAEAVGVPLGTVKSRIHNALAQVATTLDNLGRLPAFQVLE